MKKPVASFLRLAVGALLASSPLQGADSSLILKMPPGWNGFEMEASVTAGYRASGDPSDVLSNTEVQTATVSPTAGLSSLDEVSVPRASASMVPPSGDPADKVSAGLDVDYRVGSPTGRDTFHIDFEVNASALDAGADFGSGDVKVDAFAEVTVTLRSTAPLRAADFPGAVFSVPDLPALADPANEGMFATFRVPHRDRTSEPTSPYEPPLVGFVLPGNPGPDVFLDMRPASPLHLDETLEYTFTFEVVVPYGSASTTGYTLLGAAGLDRTLVTTTNDSGPGSLRQALALVRDGGVVAFDSALSGETIDLTSGQLELDTRLVIIEARDLADKVTVDAGGLTRGFHVRDSELELNGITISGGATLFDGGGIYCISSDLSLTDSCLLGNQANNGAAIAQTGVSNVHLERVLVTDNLASGIGGGLFLDGVWLQLGATVTDCEFEGNSATWGGALGLSPALDGVEPFFDLEIRNSTFHDNTAVQRGGASFQVKGVFEQCTFFNNTAGTKGGALLTRWPTEIRHCTITGNTAPLLFGSGVHAEEGTTTVFSSIIAGNGPSDLDIESGSFTSAGFNAVGFGLGTLPFGTATDDIKGIADPLLAPLADYGGPTPTMLPQYNSPATDTGATDIDSPDGDQRGFPRRADGDGDGASFVDAGATESEQPFLVVTNGSDSGPGSLRQAIADIPDGGLILFEPSVAVVGLVSGDLVITGKTVTIDGTRIPRTSGNRPSISTNYSSRLFLIDTGAEATLVGLRMRGGLPSVGIAQGGGIMNRQNLSMIDCEVAECRSLGKGGGIYNSSSGHLSLSRCQIRSNRGTNGGGIANAGSLAMDETTLSGNWALERGAGLISSGATATTVLERCTIANNHASTRGGGIFVSLGNLAAFNCCWHGNSAGSGGGAMGALVDITCLFEQCTFWGNIAGDFGSAIEVGGGLLTLHHCTLVGNQSNGGCAIDQIFDVPTFTLRMRSTVVAGNQGSDIGHLAGSVISEGYNVIGTGGGAGSFMAPGDQTGIVDPVLSPLGDYGGDTLTMLPLPGSPALDAGGTGPSTPGLDQRGQDRIQDGDGDGTAAIDAGAGEAYPPGTVVTVTNANDSGPGSLRQAISDALSPGLRVTFANDLDGSSLSLTSGPIDFGNKTIFLDADELTGGFNIDAGGTGRVLDAPIASGVTLRGLTIMNGLGTEGPPWGGGIAASGNLSLDSCTIVDCSTPGRGGGLAHAPTRPASLIMTDTRVLGNEGTVFGSIGGGTYLSSNSNTTVQTCTIDNNLNEGTFGGAIATSGSLSMRLCSLQQNESGLGGSLHQFGGLTTLSACTVDSNTASSEGGGLSALGGVLHVLESTLSNNSAHDGGAVATIGGAIDLYFRLGQCTFFGNHATRRGGAIQNASGEMFIHNCSISTNTAGAMGGGVATLADPAAETTMRYSIVSGNSAPDIEAFGGAHDPYSDGGTGIFGGFNLIGTLSGTTAFPPSENELGVVDPRLSPPGLYGGPTRTMIPLPDSLARDRGTGAWPIALPQFDQRGYPRYSAPFIDIGAYEASGTGGYPIWALENIPTGEDMSFGGNGDEDRNANGLEYGVGTDGGIADPGAEENLRVDRNQFEATIAFGFRPEAFDAEWRVMRSTDLQDWSEIYRYDGETEFLIPDVTALFDFDERTITVKDRNPPQPEAYYRLEVDYTP